MFLKRIETPGLAHWSYMVGDREEVIVIDPMRDVDIYLEEARKAKMRITAILETHRNEDYLSGSRELADLTGAIVYISGHEDLSYDYGTFIKDQDTFNIGSLILQALHTPGHTLGHMAYAIYIRSKPYLVFTGDCLFAGDVGRTDFYGADKLKEMTSLLYHSITQKLLPLGDHVIVCPAHGAGSACGTAIEDRVWTTVGYERKYNPKLQYYSEEAFVSNVGKILPKPPYFEKMEERNVQGVPFLGGAINFSAVTSDVLSSNNLEGKIVDVRDEGAFCASHIPGSLYIPKDSLSSYLGWFVNVEMPIYFITNDYSEDTLSYLFKSCRRIGFDKVEGFFRSGIIGWETRGSEIHSVDTVSPSELQDLLSKSNELFVLDVRKNEELEQTKSIENSIHIPLHNLMEQVQGLPENNPIYILCASGVRSTIAASILKMSGKNAVVILGGIQGWNALKNK